jgi:diguanylate cyclase (GGDEF)-like protein
MVVVHIKSTMADSASNSDVNLDELTLRLRKAPTVVSASGNPNACLIQIHPIDDKLGSLFPVAGGTLVIGRDRTCQLCIPADCVSRVHATLSLKKDAFHLADNQSTNGTFVNDRPVTSRPLHDGDYVRIGRHIFRFLGGGNIEMRYHEELTRLVLTDPLTGIGNRRMLMANLDRELARAGRHQEPLSLIVADIDHFKSINDRLGHVAGDQVLRDMTVRLREGLRKEDLLARYGGDELVIVLPYCEAKDALATAERLRAGAQAEPFLFQGQKLRVTTSMGTTTRLNAEVVSPDEFLHRADECLYKAKRAGGNRVAM